MFDKSHDRSLREIKRGKRNSDRGHFDAEESEYQVDAQPSRYGHYAHSRNDNDIRRPLTQNYNPREARLMHDDRNHGNRQTRLYLGDHGEDRFTNMNQNSRPPMRLDR